MKERGKAVETYNNTLPSNFNYSLSELMPCNKHPRSSSSSSSSVGVCAYCLKERLVKLVCSDCGEQRLSSCSCSDFDVSSSYRNSCSTTLTDVGSVGRISFLLENEKIELNKIPNSRKEDKTEQVIFLRRSSSSCVEAKKSNGFWKIKRLFKKKRSKGFCDDDDNKSETTWVSNVMGVSRSRSLCSFRGNNNSNNNNNNVHNQELEGSDYAFSSAKISDVTSGIFLESDKQSNEAEHRKSGAKSENPIEIERGYYVPKMSIKESDFSAMDESKFIDLKLDLESEVNVESLKSNGLSCNFGDSLRAAVKERGLKRKSKSKSHKVWKWIFRHNSSSKKDGDMFKL
ncbi:hypothetical protein ACJIZ3_019946 [Penstemon smallii]|uniref:Uncharacterized protein n=1 Tax=Penstemon smallii TaxID=265156 RepID=A0ABD3T2K7_9LAMI